MVMPPSRARRSVAGLAMVLATLVLPSCGTTTLMQPDCESEDPDTLTVIAQSVPTAELVPCISSLAPGWEFDDLSVDQDGATMLLSSDRGGDRALTVTYERACMSAGAKRTPSDETGARRFERVRSVSPSYAGVRYYDFRGGCVRYDFELETDLVSGLLNAASLMMSFTTREDLRLRVAAAPDDAIQDAP